MALTELTIKIIIIVSPGIITSLIIQYLTISKKQSDFKFAIVSIVFGLVNYLVLQFLYWTQQLICVHQEESFRLLRTLEELSAVSNKIYWGEVIIAIILSIVLGFVYSYMDHHKVINKLGWFFNVTNKYGSENAYSYFLNFRDLDYVYIRKVSDDLTYRGKVSIFSEKENVREVILEDVTVYRYCDSEYLYDIDKIYLLLDQNVIIEKPNYIEEDGQKQNKPKTKK
jgi:hypothetical protein